MEIRYGARVVTRDGRDLGTVNHIMPDTWTGEIRKFIVRQETDNKDLVLSPDDVLEATELKITLKSTFNEAGEKLEP